MSEDKISVVVNPEGTYQERWLGQVPAILLEFEAGEGSTLEDLSLVTTVTGFGGVPAEVEEIIGALEDVIEMLQQVQEAKATFTVTDE